MILRLLGSLVLATLVALPIRVLYHASKIYEIADVPAVTVELLPSSFLGTALVALSSFLVFEKLGYRSLIGHVGLGILGAFLAIVLFLTAMAISESGGGWGRFVSVLWPTVVWLLGSKKLLTYAVAYGAIFGLVVYASMGKHRKAE